MTYARRRSSGARRHRRVRKKVTGTAAAAAPGGVPVEPAHLRAGDRRRRRAHARRGVDRGGRRCGGGRPRTVDAAKAVGKRVGERAKAAGVETVVFDRGGFRYHGRVAAVADGAREAGLEF